MCERVFVGERERESSGKRGTATEEKREVNVIERERQRNREIEQENFPSSETSSFRKKTFFLTEQAPAPAFFAMKGPLGNLISQF